MKTNDVQKAIELLKKAERILIISHRGPDADSIGSNLALRLALIRQWNKSVISACIDPPAANCDFLEDFATYATDFDLSKIDLIVSVDCGARNMVSFGEKKPTLFSGIIPFINIDHHTSNDNFGTVNLVDDHCAAAVQIVYNILVTCGFRIDRHIATCLLAGLYFDTGSFMHSNTTPEVLSIAARLLWKGADFKTIVRKQFHSMTLPQLKIFGRILESARVNDKKITVSAINVNDLKETGAQPSDTNGVIDYLNSVPDGNFCCLVYEDPKHGIKGSLRTQDDEINLSKLAGLFGGGGHRKAAGFSFPGRLRNSGNRFTLDA